jgi:two-component system aerobic respiration control sensor histidine kinase ArcB
MKSNEQQTSIEHLPGIFYLIDKEGVIINYNFGLAKILDFDQHEMLKGLNLYELLTQKYHKQFVSDLKKQHQEILIQQQNKTIKENWQNTEAFLSYKTPIGNQLQNLSIPLNNYNEYGLNLSPEFNQQTSTPVSYSIASNSTDYLLNLIASMPGNVYWKDKEGRFLGCNNNFAKIMKLDDPRKIIGLRDLDILVPEMAIQVLDFDQEIIKNNQPVLAEEEGFDLHGTKTTYLSHKVPLRDINGNAIGIIGISLNINEHKQLVKKQLKQAQLIYEQNSIFTERYLYDNNEYLFNIITLMPGNVYWKDLNGRYLGCNYHFAKIVKINDPKDIIGVRDIDLFSASIANEVLKIDEEIIKNNKPSLIEEVGFDDEGRKIVYLSHKVPLQNKLGEPVGLLGISLDITDRKEMENQLKNAMQLADRANQAKSQFLLNMSHDIRTPLNGIMGMAQILKTLETDDHKLELINSLMISTKTLVKLCSEIIEYADIYKHGIPIRKNTFSPTELLNSLEQILKAPMKKKKLEFHIQLDSRLPTQLMGDEMRLHRIMLNLLGNAVKFTDQGHIMLKFELKGEHSDRVTVQIQIIDTGIGIPADKFDYIFEYFSRLTLSDRSKYKGTGLGLSIVKQFVNDLNGSISVQSKVNQGTRFTVVLPFYKTTAV